MLPDPKLALKNYSYCIYFTKLKRAYEQQSCHSHKLFRLHDMRRYRLPRPLNPRLMDDQISKEKTVSDSCGALHTQVLEMDYTEAKYLSYFKITYAMRYGYVILPASTR